MDNHPNQDHALEALFDAAKSDAPAPTPDFMALLARDADNALPKPAASIAPPATSISVLSRLKGLFAASGLTGAAALGVWIGLVMPETLSALTDGFAADETVSLSAFLPSADLAALSE